MSAFGHVEGEICRRNRCTGIVKESPVDNCSCHITAPCSQCTSPRAYCEVCGWDESEDRVVNDYVVSVDKKTGVFRSWEPRHLDSSKLDWRSFPHSSSSMIKEGVYPASMSHQEVEAKVRGTFGGRFEYFRDGKFKYIAYTD